MKLGEWDTELRAFLLYDYYNSCEGRCYHNDIDACRCDSDCKIFKDCCYDYDVMCNASTFRKPESWIHPELYGCYTIDVHSVLLVDKCPTSWKGQDIKLLCISNVNDMFVFDRYGNNFRNVFCALCNHRKIHHVYPWNMIPHDLLRCYDTSSFKGSTFLHFKNSRGLEFIVGAKLRLCYLSSQCPSSAEDSFAEKCESALVYHNQQCNYLRMYKFKNPYCYVCTYGYFPQCRGLGYKSMWQFRAETYKAVQPQQLEPCLSNEVRDPITQLCRQISCRPGYQASMTSTSCIQNKNTNSLIVDNWHCTNMHSLLFFKILIKKYDLTICLKDLFDSYGYGGLVNREYKITSHDNMEWRAFEMNNDTDNPFALLQFIDRSIQHDTHHDANMNREELFCGVTDMKVLLTCDNSSSNEPSLNCTGDWYAGSTSDFLVVNISYDMSSILYLPNDTYIVPTYIIYHAHYFLNVLQSQKKDVMFVCGEMTDSTWLDCSFVVLNSSEYIMKENDTLLVYGGEEFQSSTFLVLPDRRAHVCVDPFSDKHFDIDDDIINSIAVTPMDIVSVVTTTMSILGSLGTLITYTKFKRLRNIFGTAIMSLSVALLMAQLLNILSDSVHFWDEICVALGVIKHYFWLATFTWTSTGACILFVQFATDQIHSRSAVSTGTERMMALQILGWGLPLLFVGIVSTLQFLKSSPFGGMLYSASSCWIVAGLPNFMAFGVPVATSLSLNSALIMITLMKLRKARMRSNKLQNKEEKNKNWADVMMFAKVNLIFSVLK